jgi:hypothetical protein
VKKLQANAGTCFPPARVTKILALFDDVKSLEWTAVDELIEKFLAKTLTGSPADNTTIAEASAYGTTAQELSGPARAGPFSKHQPRFALGNDAFHRLPILPEKSGTLWKASLPLALL